MANFKVSFEIDIEAEDPISAAKEVQSWLRHDNWQYYVQNDETKDIYSVDLEECEEDKLYPVNNYQPFIVPKK